MVKTVIALSCVCLVLQTTSVFAQERLQTPRLTNDPDRNGSPARTASQTPAIRPVTRTQPQDAPADRSGISRLPDSPDAAASSPADEILNQQAPEMSRELLRELDRILEYWAVSSSKIERLQGRHFRIVYDTAFEVEKQSEGEFAYEKPDKGRIDITPIQITEELRSAREKEVIAAQREKRPSQIRTRVKDGVPYDLVQEQQERWSCDGQRVYSVDIEKKEAVVAQLPADMQGGNIMDSPLPFLFGMPAEKTRQRFTVFFTNGQFDPKTGRAYLTMYPKEPKDAQAWRQADVILDLREFLPVAVKLTDPAGTKITVYKFRDFKKNQKSLPEFLGMNPKTHFTPDLRELQVVQVGEDRPPQIGGNGNDDTEPISTRLVNVTGMNHETAVTHLQRQGLQRIKGDKDANQIVLEAGPPAKRPEDIFTVKSQDPAPGTPLRPGMKVRLTIWTGQNTSSN